MQLFKTKDSVYVGRTVYGEWQPKQAGFTWDKLRQVWFTQDVAKAEALAETVGLTYVEEPAVPKPVPSTDTPRDTWPTVHEGRYAVVDPEDGVLKFYRIDKPKEGKWAGWTFLKVQSTESFYQIKEPLAKKRIMDEIAKAPYQALCRYGLELGHCGHCGKVLTDAESRAVGIGPVCRKKITYWKEAL